MRLEKWFISNLDDSQRQIIIRDPNENLIVQGSAGSGKTNLAIHRAVQASAFSDSYALVVYTMALKRMVAYGLDVLGLDKERIAYDWAWEHRGFDLIGDVYCRGKIKTANLHPVYYLIQNEKVYKFENSKLGNYIVSVDGVKIDGKFRRSEIGISPSFVRDMGPYSIRDMGPYSICTNVKIVDESNSTQQGEIYYFIEISNKNVFIVQNGVIRQFEKVQSYDQGKKDYPNDLLVSIDFADWVAGTYYRNFGRRVSWFREIPVESGIDITDSEMVLIPSGTLFRKAEGKIDYLIVDEAQDFDVSDYQKRFLPKVNKSISLFGDSAQKIYNNRGASMDAITAALRYRRLFLKYNYRLPKSIAKVAQDIAFPSIDLLSDNMKDGGNSDYPQYPKPIIQKLDSKDKELEAILNKIRLEDLDDVAILVPLESDVKYVHQFFSKNGMHTQVLYRTGKIPPYRTINTLDFTNNDLPCILTYHAAKGTEFDNVFVPFANDVDIPDRNAFYVACTRASHSLTISFSAKKITKYLTNVIPNTIVERNVPDDAWVGTRPNKNHLEV